MDTEPEVNPVADDVVTPEVEATEPQQETEATEGESLDGEQPDGDDLDDLDKLLGKPDAEPELLDIEYEGKAYKLPPELKDALLRQQDYTKKTMDLAEQRKAAEAEREQLDQFRNLSNERMTAVQSIMTLDAQIEQINNTPLEGLSETDVIRLRQDLTDLQNQRTQWASFGQQLAQREEAENRQQIAKAVEAAAQQAALSIPNFTERRSQLAEYISARGGNPDMVSEIADPIIWQVLDDADIGRRYRERQAKAKTIKDAAAVKPAHQVGGKADAGVNPEKMTTEQWMKWREQQVSAR